MPGRDGGVKGGARPGEEIHHPFIGVGGLQDEPLDQRRWLGVGEAVGFTG